MLRVRRENIPVHPASDWSVVGIYPCILRPIGPSWEYTRASCFRLVRRARLLVCVRRARTYGPSCREGVNASRPTRPLGDWCLLLRFLHVLLHLLLCLLPELVHLVLLVEKASALLVHLPSVSYSPHPAPQTRQSGWGPNPGPLRPGWRPTP
eukprot:1196353-Prorocentrum_minimum.AAC.6